MQSASQKSLQRCSLYFGILSILLAGLISLGTESWTLVLIVFPAVVIGHLYTDVLKWFSLPKFVVYLLMIAGAVFAAFQFLRDGGLERINAVGDLLVYVQLPLIFQKKNKRVFEQWGIFLLLELVVSALVNSDMLFGILIVPILVVGVAALMSLASYNGLEAHSRSQATKNNIWSKFSSFLGRDESLENLKSGIKLETPQGRSGADQTNNWDSNGGRPKFGPIVISFGALIFTLAYFYLLPRMSVGAFEVSEWGKASVGISDQISLRYRGTIKPNDTPVLRMQLFHKETQEPFVPVQPPYIRITVLQHYLDGPTRGVWQKGEPTIYGDHRGGTRLPTASHIHPDLIERSDPILVSIAEKTSLRETVACIPPFSEITKRESLMVSRRDWRILDSSEEVRLLGTKRNYAFQTYAFLNGSEKRVLPNFAEAIVEGSNIQLPQRPNYFPHREELTHFPSSLTTIIPFRDELLKDCLVEPTDKLGRALHLEQDLAYNPEFTYSLRQSPPQDPTLDPIADFLLNRKKGHCEYYASGLAMLFRSMNIPSRIILGFRPMDFNELGGYFTVRQEHAHAWVEGFFSAENIRLHPNLARQFPESFSEGAWIRFDPTPAGEDSNAGVMFKTAERQTLNVMEDFWSEMIMNMDRTRQSDMMDIFGAASKSSYLTMWEQFQAWLEQLRNHPLLQGLSSPRNWFSWRAAIFIFTLGGISLGAYQLWIWFFPTWSLMSLKNRQAKRSYQYAFYNKLMQSLKRLGIEPKLGQTQREFWQETAGLLEKHSVSIDWNLIAESFYQLRYGGLNELDPEKERQLDNQLQLLDGVTKQQLLTMN